MIDWERLFRAVDFAMDAPKDSDVFIHYEQKVSAPHRASVFIEVSVRRGLFSVEVKNFGGFPNPGLTEKVRIKATSYLFERENE